MRSAVASLVLLALGFALAPLALAEPDVRVSAPSTVAATTPPSSPAAGEAPAEGTGSGASPGARPESAPVHAVDSDGDDEHAPQPAPAAPAKAGNVRIPFQIKDGMIRIPGGRFMMGSADKAAPANERPVRAVQVTPFWIDRTEVSVGAYRACVERGGCQPPARVNTTCTYDMGDPELPASCVSWAQARAFCASSGKRLPREVEWEFAARGSQGGRYPWGGGGSGCGLAATLVHDATQRSCSGKRPARVGAHVAGASPFGVLDMSGNVEEWIADWYSEGVSDLSPRAGASHVLRGGGWLSPPSLSRATSRNWGSVQEAGPNVGFRCARDVRDD